MKYCKRVNRITITAVIAFNLCTRKRFPFARKKDISHFSRFLNSLVTYCHSRRSLGTSTGILCFCQCCPIPDCDLLTLSNHTVSLLSHFVSFLAFKVANLIYLLNGFLKFYSKKKYIVLYCLLNLVPCHR